EYVYFHAPAAGRSRLSRVAHGDAETLFFDYLPSGVPRLLGYQVRLHLQTVDGTRIEERARELLLKGADGVIFVADGGRRAEAAKANEDGFRSLLLHLAEQGLDWRQTPHAIQLNPSGAGAPEAAQLRKVL